MEQKTESISTEQISSQEKSIFWNMKENTFCMLMHLSQLVSLIVPIAVVGIVLPIIMWATNKDKSETINKHGKNIINWMISETIYFVAAFVLIFIGVGVVLLIALGVCSTIFIIIAAVKANDKKIWSYPLAIEFLK